jgi:hypothetical protein
MELVEKRGSDACIASVLTSDYGHRIALSWTGRGVLPEEPTAVVPHGGVCVQRRLACSAGSSPAGVAVRSPVARIAERREIDDLKPIDRPSYREGASHRAVTKVNADMASKVRSPEGRAHIPRAKAAWAAEI